MHISIYRILILTMVALIMLVVLVSCKSKAIPEAVEVFGSFEVVTHTHRFTSGWNTGRLGRGTTEKYTLRYRSRQFSFEGKAGMWGNQVKNYETFNSIITFPSIKPAVVVNVGDPNNKSYYYLIHEEGEKAVVKYLGSSTGGISAQWLDPSDEGTLSPVVNTALHRGQLEGGRWLLLGQYTVLDTRSLKHTVFKQPKDFSPNQFKPPITMAPDNCSFVCFGYTMAMSNAPKLAVFEFGTGTSYTLTIDRLKMRYNNWTEIDVTWLNHHYEWKLGTDKRLHLLERTDYKPLPHCGSLKKDLYDRHLGYKLSPVKQEMLDRVVTFLVDYHEAKLQPRGPHGASDVFLIGQKKINVMFHGKDVMIWVDKETDNQLIEEVAAGFDKVLRTGELDDLFVFSSGGE